MMMAAVVYRRVLLAAIVLLTGLAVGETTLPEKHWERIDLDDEHTSIETSDKSRGAAAIPVDTAGDLSIPSTLKGLKVVSIGDSAFSGCTNLTSVRIPEGVTNIAAGAFVGCSSLTNVVFPSSLQSIGESAFYRCSKLEKLDLSLSRLAVGKRAFEDCTGLDSVFLDVEELSLGEYSFSACTGLRRLDVRTKLLSVGEYAFSAYNSEAPRCRSLVEVSVESAGPVTFGGSVFSFCQALSNVVVTATGAVTFGAQAFYGCSALISADVSSEAASTFGVETFSGCTALKTARLPQGLTGVSSNMFYQCAALEGVTLSSNVTAIAYRAFDGCSALSSVSLAEGLRKIEDQSFFGCRSLGGRLTLPQSLSSVGDRAFEQCGALEELVICGGDTNIYAAGAVEIGDRTFYANESLTNVVLSEAVSGLGAKAFAECVSLARVNLPTTLVEVAESLFESCEALSSVEFPATLSAIGKTAFNGCLNLRNFTIPTNTVVSIGSKAFRNTGYWNDWPDDSLVTNNGYILGFKGNPKEVTLPETCRTIPEGMFEDMTSLTNVLGLANVVSVGARAFAGSGIQSVDLSQNLVQLGISAFDGCLSLETCTLSENLSAIPQDAFRNCSTLTAIDIPARVVAIGDSAFRDCVRLQTLTGGEGVLSVGDYAFAGCSALQPFRFPEDVAYGVHVFQSVTWTEYVLAPTLGTLAEEYPNTYSNIRSVILSSSMTGVVSRAFANCVSLEWIEVPNGVRSIGEAAFENCGALTSVVLRCEGATVDDRSFVGCTGIVSVATATSVCFSNVFSEVFARLTSVTLLEGLAELGNSAFAGCVSLTSLRLPNSVDSIGDSAFAGCVALGPSLIIPASVGSIGDFAFSGCTGLSRVNYLGDAPEVTTNLYAGTAFTLRSGVLRDKREKWGGEAPDEYSTALYWPAALVRDGGRMLSIWVPSEEDFREAGLMTFYYYDGTGKKQLASASDGLYEEPEREGYEFEGWYSKPYGGVLVTEENSAEFSSVYAHWAKLGADDEPPLAWDEIEYDVNKAHVYDGYLLDGDSVIGTVQVKAAKGKYSAATEETSVGLTASVVLLGEGKKISLKGKAESVDEGGGSADLVAGGKSEERELSVSFAANELSGSFDGYDVVAKRNLFAEATDFDRRAARAALEDFGGTRVVALRADGEASFSSGYVTLTVKVGAKGKTKVSGSMPDGTKVSVSTQLQIGNEDVEIPVVAPLYTGKKGGFGFVLKLTQEASVVDHLSDWVGNPGKADEFVSSLTLADETGIGPIGGISSGAFFSLDGEFDIPEATVASELLPDGVEIAVSGNRWSAPKADTVKFDRETESWEIVKDNGNPSGLTLSYAGTTGAFKGKFSVYAVTDSGKKKKYAAQVAGVVLNGTGYGTATVKKIGSCPVVIMGDL